MSIIFDNVTLHVLWHITSKVGFIIIKITFFIYVNSFLLLYEETPILSWIPKSNSLNSSYSSYVSSKFSTSFVVFDVWKVQSCAKLLFLVLHEYVPGSNPGRGKHLKWFQGIFQMTIIVNSFYIIQLFIQCDFIMFGFLSDNGFKTVPAIYSKWLFSILHLLTISLY